MIHIFKIHHKILYPERRSFSYGSRLRSLEMRKSKGRHILIFHSELRKLVYDINKTFFNKSKSFRHNYYIRIVTYITACCSKMYYGFCQRRLKAVSVNMAHNIVTDYFFTGFSLIVIYVIYVLFHLSYLLIRNIQTKFLFRLGKGYPKFSPS